MSNSLGVLTLDLIANIGSYIEPLNRAERQTRQSTGNINNSLGAVDRQANQTNSALKVLSTTAMSLAGYFSVSAIKNYADSFTNLHNRLKLVTQVQNDALKSQVNLQLALSDTFRIAQAAAADWGGTSAIYEKIYKNSELLKLSQQEVGQVAETVSKAISNSGSSAQAAAAALYQLGQSFDKGNLNGDEFVSISENAGYLMDVFAKGLGVTRKELRQMSTDGMLTAEVMTKALRTMYEKVNADYANTQTSLAGGWNLISNSIQDYVGRSDQALGATSTIVSSMTVLSENIENVVTIGSLMAAFWVGTYIPAIVSSTVAGYAKVKQTADQIVTQVALTQAQRVAAAQELLNAQTTLRNVQATLAALAAEKALEIERMKAQINQVGRIASATRMAQLRRIEAQATLELTVAQNALTAAQTRANATAMTGATVGRGLLGVLGGPVGMGITVATLAAGYLMMSNGADKANSKLAEQAQVASKTREELIKLQGVERKSAIDDMTTALDAQNKELRKSELAVGSALIKIQNFGQYNAELTEISNKARLGTISYTDALQQLNQMDLPPDLYNNLKKQVEQYNQNSISAQKTTESLGYFGVKTQAVGNQAQNAALQHKQQSSAIDGVTVSASSAASALTEYQKKLGEQTYAATYLAELMAKGVDRQKAEMMLQAQLEVGRGKSIQAYRSSIDATLTAESKKDALIKSQTESLKQQTKEADKQLKTLQVNAKVQENAKNYNFGGLESQYGLPAGALSAIHMIESRGNAQAYNASSGASGGFQFLSGTAKQYGVTNRNDLGQSAQGAAKYLSYLLNLFKGDLEKAVRAYHAGEGNVQRGTNIGKYNNQYWADFQGYMGGINGYEGTSSNYETLMKDNINFINEQAKQRRQIELDIADEVTKIREKLSDDLVAIDAAGFDAETTADLRAKYQERADVDIEIFRDQQQQKLDSLLEYRKSEKQLLLDAQDEQIKAFDRDNQLTTDQKMQAIMHIRERTDYELKMIELASEKRLFEVSQVFMSETQIMQQRYKFERDEIERNSQLAVDEKNRLIALSIATEAKEKNDRLLRTSGDWAEESVQMNGTSEYFRLGQDRASQESKSEELMLAETASANTFEEEEAAWQAHADRMLAIEQDYQDKKANLNLSYGEQIFASTTDILARTLGEQSAFYKASFATQKIASIASSIVAIKTGIAQAAANPFPLNLGAMATVAAATASIVSDIDSVAGVFHGGTDYVPKEASYLLDKGERVLSPKQNQDFTRFMDQQKQPSKQGGGDVIIHNYGADVGYQQNSDGDYEFDVRVRKAMDSYFPEAMSNAGSRIHKSVVANTTATTAR